MVEIGVFNVDNANTRQKVITTTVDKDDWEYAQKHNLKWSHMIRAFIRDHRVAMEDPDAVQSAREVFRKMKVWQELANKQREFISEKGLFDDYIAKN